MRVHEPPAVLAPRRTPAGLRTAVLSLVMAAEAVVAAGVPTVAVPDTVTALPRCDYRVVETLPHRADAFTQGLAFAAGRLYEGTGLYGRSALTVLDPSNGHALRQRPLASGYFGEGVTVLGERVYQLTWREGVGFIYDRASLQPLGRFRYSGEGWGLAQDGERLIMSDGSATLRFLEPATLTETRRVTVRAGGRPLDSLNELEHVDGELLANVWHTDAVVRIDPADGRVLGWLDVGPLRRREGRLDAEAVPNGIAFDPEARRLLLTGKLWSRVYAIRPYGIGCGALVERAEHD